jgi:hypothetical protein
MTLSAPPLLIELSAVVVCISDNAARVLTLKLPPSAGAVHALPSGPFEPHKHRTFDLALRAFVREQTGFDIGYVEQLYSFGDDGRQASQKTGPGTTDVMDVARVISIGYLALTPQSGFTVLKDAQWLDFTTFFPWEDWRCGEPDILKNHLRPALLRWSAQGTSEDEIRLRTLRIDTLFAADLAQWNEERVLERYELLFEAEVVGEARRGDVAETQTALAGLEMLSDHRRILATGLSRLRGKVKYRPVIFELMGPAFTLSELQRALEAISGLSLHKQNFRRSLERTGFVMPLGRMREDTGGRPAELFTYDVERFHFSPSSGLSLPRA